MSETKSKGLLSLPARKVSQGDIPLGLMKTSLRSRLSRTHHERHIKDGKNEIGLGNFSLDGRRAEFNGVPTKRSVRYGGFKGAPNVSAAVASGASAGDVKWDLEHGFIALHWRPRAVSWGRCRAMVAKSSMARG
jgi:hypothetical protein